MPATAKPEASVSKQTGLAESKCASTGALVKALQGYTNDQIIAMVSEKSSRQQLFFPRFSISIIGLAIRKKLLMKCL